MDIVSTVEDKKINAKNALVVMTTKEYLKISKDILKNNEFQRDIIKSSSSVFSLLKQDLKKGCIIPPIVLALSNGNNEISESQLIDKIESDKKNLIILDGLQRTFTLLTLEKELIALRNNESQLTIDSDSNGLYEEYDQNLSHFYDSKLRIEVYFGLNKLGVLYRMLTLNTGQTQMSVRHQIEILYSEYLNQDFGNVILLREIDKKTHNQENVYVFRDVIEGFNAYLDRDELPMNKFSIIDVINSIEKLAKENHDEDLFKNFVEMFSFFVCKMRELTKEWRYSETILDISLSGEPFAKDTDKLFKRPQVMSGFGAAIGKLIDDKETSINNIKCVETIIKDLTIKDNNAFMKKCIESLDDIKKNAKKIGNDQRLFFMYFFKELFGDNQDGFKDLLKSVNEAYKSYFRKVR